MVKNGELNRVEGGRSGIEAQGHPVIGVKAFTQLTQTFTRKIISPSVHCLWTLICSLKVTGEPKG